MRKPFIALSALVLAATSPATHAVTAVDFLPRTTTPVVPGGAGAGVDADADAAIDIDGDFTWETVRKDANAINLAAKFDKDAKRKAKTLG